MNLNRKIAIVGKNDDSRLTLLENIIHASNESLNEANFYFWNSNPEVFDYLSKNPIEDSVSLATFGQKKLRMPNSLDLIFFYFNEESSFHLVQKVRKLT